MKQRGPEPWFLECACRGLQIDDVPSPSTRRRITHEDMEDVLENVGEETMSKGGGGAKVCVFFF